MAFKAGEAVHLKKVKLYDGNSASAKQKSTKTGTFYIYNGSVKNKRVRICQKAKFAKKTPESKYCLGWVFVADLINSEKYYLAEQQIKQRQQAQKNASNANKKAKAKTSGTGGSSGSGTPGSGNNTPKAEAFTGTIGSLGDVKFEVVSGASISFKGADTNTYTYKLNAGKVLTPSDFSISESVEISQHELHMSLPKLEITGVNLKEISLTIPLSLALGVKPMANYKTLRGYMESGKVVALKLGHEAYGNFVIKSLSFSGEETSRWGDWIQASASVSLLQSN